MAQALPNHKASRDPYATYAAGARAHVEQRAFGSKPTGSRPESALASQPARHLVLGRTTACGLGLALASLAAWAGAATWMLAARDDFAQTFFLQDTDHRYALEDRIKALQTELERAVTLNLVERNTVSTRIEGLARRQADIEGRQVWLKRAAGRLSPGGALARAEGERDEATGSLSDAPPIPAAAPEAGEPLPLRRLDTSSASEPAGAPRDRLSFIEGSLARVAEQEVRLLGDLQARAGARLARLQGALAAVDATAPRAAPKPAGGPLVPLPPGAAGGAFGSLAAELQGTLDALEGMRATARSLPLGRPLAGALEMTSSFGYRFDPFTRSPALHTGTDYRAEYGATVRATASGRVIGADFSGGYGNLIEIDHGGGLTTRYGHLSAFLVSPGMRVEAGEPVGRAGSTGRSTGTHLHYETRINGEPMNPARFLEAGARFAEMR